MDGMAYGQLVIGPPGSGKTTYCQGIQQLLKEIHRKVVVVNIDPANEVLPYECGVNISQLITLDDVMKEMHLGPNGGLVYCMEYLETNFDWFLAQLAQFPDHYLIIDCPGQVELYTHHHSIRNIVQKLCQHRLNLVAVHLVDSYYCTDPSKFISALITSLSTMMQVELPHINVLSKLDLIEKYGKLDFNLDFYTEVLELSHMTDMLSDDPFFKKYKKLSASLASIVQDYGLVSFIPLNIQDSESRLSVLKAADRANGYVYGSAEEKNSASTSTL